MASLAVIPLQLLGYYVSVAKGLDVDKPGIWRRVLRWNKKLGTEKDHIECDPFVVTPKSMFAIICVF